jgi:alpha-amylase/alpha-mannosidase (GH57 family)
MPERYICVHAHFYQPPRENPWLYEIEEEKSAEPFHNWNERITRECYAANTASRLMSGELITGIVNNFEKISFNFGPTLLSWMSKHEPVVYEKILESDRKSIANMGHGNAIAQVYNHSIMPLNSTRDKETQVIWGIRDFELRFKRKPEGIWFAETAVDSESLAIAARHGIKFTILAPSQAKRVRSLGAGDEGREEGWIDLNGDVDTTRPYLFRAESGEEIAIFFYHGELSHSIAFNGALSDGVQLAEDIVAGFNHEEEEAASGARLVHIATDGESYGHHHRFGEMGLSSLIGVIDEKDGVEMTNYGRFLEQNRPGMEVEIVEDSSWSCPHGVERWRADCGCSVGGGKEWTQEWRAPLWDGMNLLKTELDEIFESEGKRFFKSPWEARNGYIDILVDRTDETIDAYLEKHSALPMGEDDKVSALKLLEMQSDAMKMFTSCGWFFSDIAGLEGKQVLKYAARAIDIAGSFTAVAVGASKKGATDIEKVFLDELEKGESNMRGVGSGADLYRKTIKPLAHDPDRVAVQTVMLNSLKLAKGGGSVYCFDIVINEMHSEEGASMSLSVGWLVRSDCRTREKIDLQFCLLNLSEHEIICFVEPYTDEGRYTEIKEDLLDTFRGGDGEEVLSGIKKHFLGDPYTIGSLFGRETYAVRSKLTQGIREQVGKSFIEFFEQHREFMEYFISINVPVPDEMKVAAKYVFEQRLDLLFTDSLNRHDHKELDEIFKNAERWDIRLGHKVLRKNVMEFLDERLKEIVAGAEFFNVPIAEIIKTLNRHDVMIDSWEMENNLYPFYIAATDKKNRLHSIVTESDDLIELLRLFRFDV